MSRTFKRALMLIISFLLKLVISIPSAYPNDYLHVKDSGFTLLPVGARAKGMAEAFVAVADDYEGGCFNPAGLVQIERGQIGTMYSDLYGLGLLRHSFLCYAEPTTDKGTGQISWNHLAADFEPGKWNYDLFCYSYGQFFKKSSSSYFNAWGAAVKYLSQTTDWSDATGYSLDLGFLTRRGKFSSGISLQNVFSQISWKTGKRESLSPNVRIGAAYRFTPRLLIALDVNASLKDIPKEVCLGSEWYLSDCLALRLGVSGVFQKSFDLNLSTGLGFYLPLQGILKIRGARFDYAFSYHEALDNTHQFSLVLDL